MSAEIAKERKRLLAELEAVNDERTIATAQLDAKIKVLGTKLGRLQEKCGHPRKGVRGVGSFDRTWCLDCDKDLD